MAICPILRLGHPVLRQKARELSPEEIASPGLKMLIEDMVETLKDAGGIGLAAPQIGVSLRLAIIQFEADNSRYSGIGNQPLTVFINPRVKLADPSGELKGFWEGCLSVPGLRGYVERPQKIEIDYLDEAGKPQHLVAENFLATVFQHEFDHLDGVLYVDRLKDSRQLVFTEEFVQFIEPGLKSRGESALPED